MIDSTLRAEIEANIQGLLPGMAWRAITMAYFRTILEGEGLPPSVVEHALKSWLDTQNHSELHGIYMQQHAKQEAPPVVNNDATADAYHMPDRTVPQ